MLLLCYCVPVAVHRADVDCDDLFMKVKTLTLRCGLPSADDGEVRPLQEEPPMVPQDAGTGEEEKKEDGAVSVRVVLGPRVFSKDFPSLTDGATYILERAVAGDDDFQQKQDLANLRKLTGDKWRRLSVAVDPLLHIEAQKAILQMRRGKNKQNQKTVAGRLAAPFGAPGGV